MGAQYGAVPAGEITVRRQLCFEYFPKRFTQVLQHHGQRGIGVGERVSVQLLGAGVKNALSIIGGACFQRRGRQRWGDRLRDHVVIQHQGAVSHAQKQREIAGNPISCHAGPLLVIQQPAHS